MDVLFKTVHGSRLYGLAHADSDEDFFTVVSKVKTNKKKFAKQSIVDGIDTTTMDMGTWLHYCEIGVPQALEAMFSEMAVVDHIGPLRAQYRAGTQVWERYLRTIKSFALEDDFKHKRHSLRLAYNLNTMAHTGRFNPTCGPVTRELLTDAAERLSGEQMYEYATQVAWEGLDRPVTVC